MKLQCGVAKLMTNVETHPVFVLQSVTKLRQARLVYVALVPNLEQYASSRPSYPQKLLGTGVIFP